MDQQIPRVITSETSLDDHTPYSFAINGLGRIGTFVGAIAERNEIATIAAINQGTLDPESAAQQLAFDSVQGDLLGSRVRSQANSLGILIDERAVPVTASRRLDGDFDWRHFMEKPIIIESTPGNVTRELMQRHQRAGSSLVIATSPSKDPSIPTIVMGVNDTDENLFDRAIDQGEAAVSSCSTNCIGSVLGLVLDNIPARIVDVSVDITHAQTASQRLSDGSGNSTAKRRSVDNIIEASSGAAVELDKLFGGNVPADGISIGCVRVPVADGSYAPIRVEFEGDLKEGKLHEALISATSEGGSHFGIVGLSDELFSKRVSTARDINALTSVIDIDNVHVRRKSTGTTEAKIPAWYSNEFGFSNRVVDVMSRLAAMMN